MTPFQIIFNPTSAAELSKMPRDLQLQILGQFRGLPQELLREDAERAYAHYEELLNEGPDGEPADPDRPGIARELARMNLSLNFYTQWYWKTDLLNLLNFLSLRADPHAQYEIRVYAEAMLDIVKRWVPWTYEAFEQYRLKGVSLSAKGWDIVKGLIDGNPGQVLTQLWGSLVTIAWCAVATFIILKIVDAMIGLRVTTEEEVEGLDINDPICHAKPSGVRNSAVPVRKALASKDAGCLEFGPWVGQVHWPQAQHGGGQLGREIFSRHGCAACQIDRGCRQGADALTHQTGQ